MQATDWIPPIGRTARTVDLPRVLSRHWFEWRARARLQKIQTLQVSALILGLVKDPDAWVVLDHLGISATTRLRVVQGGRLDWRVVAMPSERKR